MLYICTGRQIYQDFYRLVDFNVDLFGGKRMAHMKTVFNFSHVMTNKWSDDCHTVDYPLPVDRLNLEFSYYKEDYCHVSIKKV